MLIKLLHDIIDINDLLAINQIDLATVSNQNTILQIALGGHPCVYLPLYVCVYILTN